MASPDPGPDGVLLLDKPAGITSTRALGMAKRILGSRKAGHTGTLDPFATGLLPLAFGQATKFSRFVLEGPKTYVARVRLGYTSTTGDVEGQITGTTPFDGDRGTIEEVIGGLLGDQYQTPPMHSALHYQGRRLYDLAREGVEVPREPRAVHIYSMGIVSNIGENLEISVKCSKGTYIRTLAESIGKGLGCGAYLIGLRRTEAGGFHIRDAVSLEFLEGLPPGEARRVLRPPQSLVAGLVTCQLESAAERAFGHGRPVGSAGPEAEVAVYGERGAFLGVGRRDGQGNLLAVRLMSRGNGADGPDFA